MPRLTRHSGFTLLELILVMVIIGTVLAIASPSLRGWSRGAALRDVADELVAAARLARSQAITTCQTHRLCIEPEGGYYLMVLQGDVFVPVASSFGQPAQLPLGVWIEVVQPEPTQQSCIDFFPTGRTQPAVIRVMSEQGGAIEVACASPAEPFEVVQAEDGY